MFDQTPQLFGHCGRFICRPHTGLPVIGPCSRLSLRLEGSAVIPVFLGQKRQQPTGMRHGLQRKFLRQRLTADKSPARQRCRRRVVGHRNVCLFGQSGAHAPPFCRGRTYRLRPQRKCREKNSQPRIVTEQFCRLRQTGFCLLYGNTGGSGPGCTRTTRC